MKKLSALAALLLLSAVTARAAEQNQGQPAQQAPKAAPAQPGNKPESLDDKASYIIGLNLGSNLKQNEVPVNLDLIVRGLRDGLAGSQALTNEEVQAAMQEFQQKMVAAQQAKAKVAGETNKKAADEFLTANKAQQGVVTTASGLQYQVLQQGTGPKPKADDKVTVNYKGTLLDGTVFDSSYDRGEPATFGVSQVIPGWVEALQLMPVGSKYKLFIPPNLAYGESGAGRDIGPNSALVFEVELLKIEPPAAAGQTPPADGHAGHAHGEQPQLQQEQKPPQEEQKPPQQ